MRSVSRYGQDGFPDHYEALITVWNDNKPDEYVYLLEYLIEQKVVRQSVSVG